MNQKEKISRNGFARLMEIAGEKKTLLICSGILSVISAMLMFTPFVSVYFILKELIENNGQVNVLYIQQMGLLAIGMLLVSLLFFYASNMCSHIAAFRILYQLRMRLTTHLAKLSLGYHTTHSTGAIKKVLELSVEKIEGFIAHQLPDMAGAIVFPFLMLGSLFYINWQLAIACTIPVVFSFLLQAIAFSGKKSMESMREYHNKLESMNAAGVEYVRGMPMVKVFGLNVKNFLKFHDAISDYRTWAMKYTNYCKRPYNLFLTILSSLLSFVVPVAIMLLSGTEDVKALGMTILLFLIISPGISIPILKLMYLGGNMKLISEGVCRMDEILNEEPLEEPEICRLPQNMNIEFEKVDFSYKAEEPLGTQVLKGISFCAKENEITALVGPSGSGKSTIAHLIPRFWDVDGGEIKIGGQNIKKIGTENLMDMVSFVFQDVHLFYDTIEENIKMGHQKSHKEVVEAAKRACCHEFIEQLPDGYDTKIGEGGTYLSGGEAQRIAIARALLKNAPILVLDEATAYADAENENKIQKAIGKLIEGKTVIVIAHRLSTIKGADQILVIENGEIDQRGTHEELLNTSMLYKRMWEAHMNASQWKIYDKEKEEREGIA